MKQYHSLFHVVANMKGEVQVKKYFVTFLKDYFKYKKREWHDLQKITQDIEITIELG